MAQEHNAINLSQGFPDFGADRTLISLISKHLKKGHNQYAPMAGVMALREQLSLKTEALYGINVNPETEITITSGATEALYDAIAATVRDGDEVLVIDPCYDSYVPAVKLHGGLPIHIPLSPEDGFAIDWDTVRKRVTHSTRMIILNTPHNPTGTILGRDDMEALIRITRQTDILILSDEVYEHIVFDGASHESVLRYPELWARSFVVFSFGKTYHATGWKIGYCLAPAYLTHEFRKVHQYVTFCTNTPIQHALADHLASGDTFNQLSAFYQEKRDYFKKLLEGTRLKALPCHGSYFQLATYAHLSEDPDTAFAERMVKEFGVAAIPVSPFYRDKTDHKLLRFCFAKETATLDAAAKRLSKL